MKAWKVANELYIPKNMMFRLNSLSGVVKATFQQSSGLMRMLLYPHHTSNLVKIDNPYNLSMRLEMKGRR